MVESEECEMTDVQLVSFEHLMTAIQMTLLLSFPADSTTPKTRTHNLHSEILLTLHTNNIISEAIKKFGISDKTQTLLVVRFGEGEQADVWGSMEKIVKGELIPLSSLDREGITDWKGVDKVSSALACEADDPAAQIIRVEPTSPDFRRDTRKEDCSGRLFNGSQNSLVSLFDPDIPSI